MPTEEDILDLLSEAPYGAYAVDMDQTIVFWNRSAERILGHKADEVIGRSCYEVLGGLSEDGLTPVCRQDCPAIRSAREGRVPPVFQARIRTGSGRQQQVAVTPLLVPAARAERTALLHLLHDEADEAQAKGVADTVQGKLSEPEPSTTPADPPGPQADTLSAREREVLRLMARGFGTDAICAELFISRTTVRSHVRHLLEKLGVHSRLEAVVAARRLLQD